MYAASRFGTKVMAIALIGCLIWTATHLFFPPLAVLQTGVIVCSYFLFRRNAVLKTVEVSTSESQ